MRVAVALIAGWIAAFALVVAVPAGVDDASTLKAEFLRDYPRALEVARGPLLACQGRRQVYGCAARQRGHRFL